MQCYQQVVFFFFSSRRRHTRCSRDWSSDVCSSDLNSLTPPLPGTRHSPPGTLFTRHPSLFLSLILNGTSKPWSTDRKSTRLNSSHGYISYAVFCLKKKKMTQNPRHQLRQSHAPIAT